MGKIIEFGPAKRKRMLLNCHRRHPHPDVRRRAHIYLLLHEGYSWRVVCAVTFCSTRTDALSKDRFDAGGIEALVGQPRGREPDGSWGALVLGWVLNRTPRDFGFLRSRWCCGAIVILLWEFCAVAISAETVRRRLHGAGLVWRRPRPVLPPVDPERKAKLARIRALLVDLPQGEVAVFEDEADINLNPKIGPMWMMRAQQATVLTPGVNQKRYVAGPLNWRTGALIFTEGFPAEGRNSALFIRHLEDLRTRLRCYRKVHVICDNAVFHDN